MVETVLMFLVNAAAFELFVLSARILLFVDSYWSSECMIASVRMACAISPLTAETAVFLYMHSLGYFTFIHIVYEL